MSDRERDIASIWDMTEAIREIQQFTAGASQVEYLDSLMLQRVVERDFEILGEAARRVSPGFQGEHREIDWRNVIGLRNVIAHQYEAVDHEEIWLIMKNLLPDLLKVLEVILATADETKELVKDADANEDAG